MINTAICLAVALATQNPATTIQANQGRTYLVRSYAYSGKPVTLSFSGTITDLLKWLRKEGVNFVALDSQDSSKKITLNVTKRPLDEVLDAVAAALGGHWDKRGETRVFVKGDAGNNVFSRSFSTVPRKGLVEPFIMPDGKQFQFRYVQPDMKGLEDLQKHMQDFNFFQPNSKGLQDLQKQMQQFNFAKPDPKVFEQLQKQLNDVRGNQLRTFTFNQTDIGSFSKSLTTEQREIMKKQGYLKPSDLTPKQRAQIGIPEKGQFEFRFKQNDDEIVVKSDGA